MDQDVGSGDGKPGHLRRQQKLLYALAIGLLLVAFVGAQLWIASSYSTLSLQAEQSLNQLPATTPTERKELEEAIALRVTNQRQRLVWVSVLSTGAATFGALAALGGIWISFRQHLAAQEKERHDRKVAQERNRQERLAAKHAEREAKEKQHLDRVATDLSQLWLGVTSDIPARRMGSVAGLQDCLTEDKKPYHRRAASALALIGRMDCDEVAKLTLTPVIEYAMRSLKGEDIQAVSWRGLQANGVNLRNCVLGAIDFRDAVLEDADFSGADLTEARLNNARLNGANFVGAKLARANLEYADLAGANFCGADLAGAVLNHAKLLDADFRKADLSGTETAWDALDWRHAKNWRQALMAESARQRLLAEHGPEALGPPRVLMLMWEMIPVVSGGGWTAAYHLITQARKAGASLLIVVPWRETTAARRVFGNEVELVFLDVERAIIIPGDSQTATAETEGRATTESTRQPAGVYGYGYGQPLGSLVNRFTARALAFCQRPSVRFDVIHAHDWLTYRAAREISAATGRPWVAHFHSIEADRRARPAAWIEYVERDACRTAARLLAPSQVTSQRLASAYAAEDVLCIPNCISDNRGTQNRVVSLDPGRVVYLGRQGWQKGSDRFIAIAKALLRLRPQTQVAMYGRTEDGTAQEASMVRSGPLTLFKPIEDDARIDAIVEGLAECVPQSLDPSSSTGLKNEAPLKGDQLRHVAGTLLRRGFIANYCNLSWECADDTGVPIATGCHRCHFRLEWQLNFTFRDTERALAKGSEIQVFDFLDWERRHEALADAAVVVVPSRHEPFGMVVVEAMQEGVPVLVAQSAGVCEQFHCLMTFDPAQAVAAAIRIVQLLRDPEAWHKQAGAQLQAIAKYRKSTPERKILELWRRLSAQPVDHWAGAQP